MSQVKTAAALKATKTLVLEQIVAAEVALTGLSEGAKVGAKEVWKRARRKE